MLVKKYKKNMKILGNCFAKSLKNCHISVVNNKNKQHTTYLFFVPVEFRYKGLPYIAIVFEPFE